MPGTSDGSKQTAILMQMLSQQQKFMADQQIVFVSALQAMKPPLELADTLLDISTQSSTFFYRHNTFV